MHQTNDAMQLQQSRACYLDAVRQMFRETDVLIFTMGLTEGWESVEDGAVFQVCPGTVGGRFDASRHRFHNFSEILADMEAFLARVRAVNPTIRVLLTVSPVALAATYSGDHVMVATSHSKAILRAVAGQLADTHANVAYFPSFEIIAARPMRGMFYQSDMRDVFRKARSRHGPVLQVPSGSEANRCTCKTRAGQRRRDL